MTANQRLWELTGGSGQIFSVHCIRRISTSATGTVSGRLRIIIRLSILEPSVMTRRRLTIARLMAIIILIALGLTAFKYALRRPSHPNILFKRFALIGRIDLNRDNQDDRQELKQIIEEAGGIVEFDFPPPDVGQQSGTLSARIDWYVIDSREPLREARSPNSVRVVAGRPDFKKRMSALIKEGTARWHKADADRTPVILLGQWHRLTGNEQMVNRSI